MESDENYIEFNTNQEKKVKIPGKPRILLAPLDWGLGHATRCIPIIRELVTQNCEVWLAGDGPIEKLLKTEFPQWPFLRLPGYNIHYSRTGRGFTGNILQQLPKIAAAVRHEHKWLKKMVKKYDFDAVISDNRFGLYHRSIPCIFITHQLTIKTSLGRWAEGMLRLVNYRYINRFAGCWVPDDENELAGQLAHPRKKPGIPVSYLGVISRFEKVSLTEKRRHLAVILSGPEPQRSIFENILIDQLVHYNGTADFIRGLPATETILPSTSHLRFYNHLPAGELNQKMAEAEFVIGRSGYSTVMDLVQLQKRGILVATPGQTEQEYLAHHLMKNSIAFCVKQDQFRLQEELEAAANFPYNIPPASGQKLRETISKFLSKLA